MVNELTRENFDKAIKEHSIAVVEFYSATCKHCKKLEAGMYEVRYATALTELDGGQKLVRFYDPSGNLIEVRTPWDKFVNRE